jgi:hypothetical protein
MPADTYRSLEPATAARVEALLDRHDRESEPAALAHAIVARRVGRIVAGVVAASLGAAALVAGLALVPPFNFLQEPTREMRQLLHHRSGLPTFLLLAAWPSALASGLLAFALARLRTARMLRAPALPPADVDLTALARLEGSPPLLTFRRLAARLEGWSAAAIAAGLSLTAPLTLHALVDAVFFRTRDYDSWIGLSALLVGPAHLVLVFLAARWALALRRRETAALREGIHRHWLLALLLTTFAGAVPCFFVLCTTSVVDPDADPAGVLTAAVLAVIPAVLTAVTGVAFVPAMYLLTARRVARERLALGES